MAPLPPSVHCTSLHWFTVYHEMLVHVHFRADQRQTNWYPTAFLTPDIHHILSFVEDWWSMPIDNWGLSLTLQLICLEWHPITSCCKASCICINYGFPLAAAKILICVIHFLSFVVTNQSLSWWRQRALNVVVFLECVPYDWWLRHDLQLVETGETILRRKGSWGSIRLVFLFFLCEGLRIWPITELFLHKTVK